MGLLAPREGTNIAVRIVPIDHWNINHKLKSSSFEILDFNYIPNSECRITLHDEPDCESSANKLIYLGFKQNINLINTLNH